MPDPGVFDLNQVFEALGGSVIVHQQRLDQEYIRDLEAFVRCFHSAGYGPMAAQFVPLRQVVQQMQVECVLDTRQTRENTFTVRFMNRVYTARYVNSRTSNAKVQVTVQRVPLARQPKIDRGQK